MSLMHRIPAEGKKRQLDTVNGSSRDRMER
jgi:hypothetical protein